MMLILFVSLLCGFDPLAPVKVTVVKHCTETEIVSTDAQCSLCHCWTVPPGGQGCAVAPACQFKSCGHSNIAICPTCIQWGPWTTVNAAGCVDMDLLPVPQEQWVYWVSQ
jgi:hypothetical protein